MKKFIIALSSMVASSYLLADGKTLYQNCTGCHGEQGELSALQQSAVIGGQESNLTIKELTAYKNGELNQYGLGDIMKMQMKELYSEDIENLATYIESMEKNTSKQEYSSF